MASYHCNNPAFAPYHGNYAHVSNHAFPSQFDDVHNDCSISTCLRCTRKLFQANIEKDCLKVMLDHALKEIVDLRVRLFSVQNSKPDACQDLLGDFLGSGEAHKATDSGKDLPSATGNVAGQEHNEFTQDADYHSDSSYIFHFAGEHNSLNDSSDEDKIILMREKASKPEGSTPQSDVNLESASPSFLVKPDEPTNSSSLEPKLPNEPATTLTTKSSILTNADRPNAEKRSGQETESNKLELSNVSGVFERLIKLHASSTEHKKTICPPKRQAGSGIKRPSEFCKLGLRYNPVSGSWNVFRTLVITNIPQEATMTAILDQVRGGVVVDAKLLDTFSITGANTALVTFLHERTAVALESYNKRYPIIIGNQTTNTTLLKTPTWPTSSLSQKAGFDGTRTRCLEVSKYPRKISPTELCRQLQVCPAMKWDRVEHMVLRDDGALVIRFHSMADAVKAKTIFTSACNFRGCVAKYAPDPCAQPLREKGESDTEKGR